jgi:hypothetical protein
MDALPAVNRPPLCTPSPILGSGSLSPLRFPRFAFPASGKSLSPLPVKECPRLSERRVPGSSPGGSTGVSRYGSAALPSPQPTHVSRPGVRRQRTATLSSPSPRSPDWAHIRVNVDHSGRGLPPTAHAHARGRKPTPQTAHDHGPRPGRPVGIHHSRPKTLTRHAAPCVSTFARSRLDLTPLPPGLERPAHKAVTACRTRDLGLQRAWPPGRPQTRNRSLVLIAGAWVKTPTVTGRHRANTGRRRRPA